VIRTPQRVPRWFTVGVVALWSLGACVPSTVLAQHGPSTGDSRPERPQENPDQEGPTYDPNTEVTFTGTVTDIKTGGPGRLGWLMKVHTLGLGHQGAQETQLLLKTDTDTVRIQLGPTAFLTDQKVEIRKGDTLAVTGSRVTMDDSPLVLARELRKADNTWTLRDAAGQPLWSAAQTERRGFWTTKKVLLTVIAVKVVLLFTVLRH
jgi:hypothetical protein